ncbi:Fc receptor-like protein 5 isoform X2 [Neoarius graeffei]|uniref:Fc receptor-like protein 5 isoform X2 n=1 Tax=Neoarius graeffei TaxID=443677 RepID=UPI00298C9E70|nr:Fc receptor-like protein 5 isoform X2 [Neoarius graeffei]
MAKMTFFLLVVLGFSAMWQAADAQIILNEPVLNGPPRSVLGSIEVFFCKMDNIPTSQTILYELYKDDDHDKLIGEYSSLHKEEAIFPLMIKHDHDGILICKASVQNNSEVVPIFSKPMVFQVVVPVDGVHIISSPFLKTLWEGDSLTLLCNISQGTYVLYSWFLNNTLLHNDSSNNRLTIRHLSSQNSGTYTCRATQELNEIDSLSIMKNMSKPEISFKVFKDVEGYFANVTCQVTKGSPPINFTLFKTNDSVTSQFQYTSFVVPIVLDQKMDTVHCQASNGKTPLQSRELNLTVESVGGTVTMKLEKFVRKNFEVLAVELSCHVERGTFPQYNWFLNNTRLESQGPFHRTFHANNSGLMVKLDPHYTNGGVYHCKVFNSFDSTTGVSSPVTLISHEVLNKIPTEVAATVFTLFSLLIFAVLACCIYGVVLRKRQARKYIFRVKDFTDMHGIGDDDGVEDEIQETEEDEYKEEEYDDLDIEAYIEDQDILQTTMIEDSDESEGEEETDFNNYNF